MNEECNSVEHLKDTIERSLKHERELRELQFKENALAVKAAYDSMGLRLDEMNALRAQITEERGTYMTRELFDKVNDAVEARVRYLEAFKSNIQGQMLAGGAVILLIQAAVAVALFFRKS